MLLMAAQAMTTCWGGRDGRLFGRAGADTFTLYRAGGSVEIRDFEAGLDIIDLTRLGDTDAGDALSHVKSTENGAVTFSDDGIDLIVGNASYSEFADSLMI